MMGEGLLQVQRRLLWENVFAELMNAVRTCSLGQITEALFEVGGKYRRDVICPPPPPLKRATAGGSCARCAARSPQNLLEQC
ncbi:MAG: hypothetical protein Ct9H300mP16_07030 [Pseudomonadota bacterium]|nr:MAG: hypothetical protein Ct9H300mP16_07030 [Pseudomonadota bacterium]